MSREDVVGLPYTTNAEAPLVIKLPPTRTRILNEVLFKSGVVENVKLLPPLDVTSARLAELLEETEKSDARLEVAPLLSIE